MKRIVTLFTQHHRFADEASVLATLLNGKDSQLVLAIAEYQPRPSFEHDATLDDDSIRQMMSAIWRRWQNFDDVGTPDNGASLQAGDLARIEVGDSVSWWMFTRDGAVRTVAPTDQRQQIGDAA